MDIARAGRGVRSGGNRSPESLVNRGANLLFRWLTTAATALPRARTRIRWRGAESAVSTAGAERSMPKLGLPRQTESLCPECGGIIEATIRERNKMVVIEKSCPEHGYVEDIIYRDVDLYRRMESLYPGDDIDLDDLSLYQHGPFGVRHSAAAVYNLDITNRCDMHCTVCFASAWDAGVVYEPRMEEIKKMLDGAAGVQPRRQASVQFTGGEPTVSPLLPEALRYAKELGFFKTQIATNGIRIAQDLDYAQELADAGLNYIYLQFDGVRNEDYVYTRDVSNMFDVKVRCIENCRKTGIDVVLVPTIVNGVNNHRVGEIVDFAIKNIDVVITISFQPVAITGRIETGRRLSQRYTLSDLALDVGRQTAHGIEPMRDWFPLSATGPISDLIDQVSGSRADWGSLKCSCHPDCGIGAMLLVNEKTSEVIPLPRMMDLDGLLDDLALMAKTPGGNFVHGGQMALSMARNFRSREAPEGLGFFQMAKNFDSATGRRLGFSKKRRHQWRLLLVAGMPFQDKYVYQFDRTRRCIIQYATPEGNISFCAYNTGADYRDKIEKTHKRGTNAEWFQEHGRNPIYSNMKDVPLPPASTPEG